MKRKIAILLLLLAIAPLSSCNSAYDRLTGHLNTDAYNAGARLGH